MLRRITGVALRSEGMPKRAAETAAIKTTITQSACA
jgi:hypothetical protein